MGMFIFYTEKAGGSSPSSPTTSNRIRPGLPRFRAGGDGPAGPPGG